MDGVVLLELSGVNFLQKFRTPMGKLVKIFPWEWDFGKKIIIKFITYIEPIQAKDPIPGSIKLIFQGLFTYFGKLLKYCSIKLLNL